MSGMSMLIRKGTIGSMKVRLKITNMCMQSNEE